MKEIRVGNGFDVHKLSVGKKIKLCGVEIKNNKKLIGHSDADVWITLTYRCNTWGIR